MAEYTLQNEYNTDHLKIVFEAGPGPITVTSFFKASNFQYSLDMPASNVLAIYTIPLGMTYSGELET